MTEPERPSPQAAAAYIRDLVHGLARMARRAGLADLANILELAHLEAEDRARDPERISPQHKERTGAPRRSGSF